MLYFSRNIQQVYVHPGCTVYTLCLGALKDASAQALERDRVDDMRTMVNLGSEVYCQARACFVFIGHAASPTHCDLICVTMCKNRIRCTTVRWDEIYG